MDLENIINNSSRSQRMRSYTTWMEWDSYEEDYTWCINFLLDRWIEEYGGMDDDWLFN
jgi:hypothetical protein